MFLREGFARASVDSIAAQAGVSKRTIYNHYGDKENLFLSVIGDTYDALISGVVDLMDKYLADLPDDRVEAGIVEFARAIAMFAARTPRRSAMIRLMMAEAPYFPALREVQARPRSITGAIAERLTKLAARGLLDVPEPVEAANHLFALTMGQINNRTLWGALPVTDDEINRMATSGAQAFLRAYRPRLGTGFAARSGVAQCALGILDAVRQQFLGPRQLDGPGQQLRRVVGMPGGQLDLAERHQRARQVARLTETLAQVERYLQVPHAPRPAARPRSRSRSRGAGAPRSAGTGRPACPGR